MNIFDMIEIFKAARVNKFSRPTPPNGNKKRGIGVTRKAAHESDSRRKMAKESRRKNRKG